MCIRYSRYCYNAFSSFQYRNVHQVQPIVLQRVLFIPIQKCASGTADIVTTRSLHSNTEMCIKYGRYCYNAFSSFQYRNVHQVQPILLHRVLFLPIQKCASGTANIVTTRSLPIQKCASGTADSYNAFSSFQYRNVHQVQPILLHRVLFIPIQKCASGTADIVTPRSLHSNTEMCIRYSRYCYNAFSSFQYRNVHQVQPILLHRVLFIPIQKCGSGTADIVTTRSLHSNTEMCIRYSRYCYTAFSSFQYRNVHQVQPILLHRVLFIPIQKCASGTADIVTPRSLHSNTEMCIRYSRYCYTAFSSFQYRNVHQVQPILLHRVLFIPIQKCASGTADIVTPRSLHSNTEMCIRYSRYCYNAFSSFQYRNVHQVQPILLQRVLFIPIQKCASGIADIDTTRSLHSNTEMCIRYNR